MPMQKTRISEAVMEGGLNLAVPPLSLGPGEAIQLHNYEVNNLQRYRRMTGYERFDGRARPSEQGYTSLQFTGAHALVVGNTVTGDTSGASGTVVAVDGTTNSVALIDVTGTFTDAETVNTAAYTLDEITIGYAPTDELDLVYYKATVDHYRALIGAVPGAGPMRGVVTYKGDVYAFRDNVGQTECVMHKSSAAGWTTVTTPTLSPGGRYKFEVANFSGSSGTFLLMGVDGVNKAFTYDGTTFTQITSGVTPDTPVALAALPTKILVLGFANGSLLTSEIGVPTNFDAVDGASEIAVADEIRDLALQPNKALAIFCSRQLQILYGTTPADFELTTFSQQLSAKNGTVQSLGDSVFLSDAGIRRLARTDQYGDFQDVDLSIKVKPLLDRYQGMASASFIVREKNQYRLCFDDGIGLILTFAGNEVIGASSFDYGMVVRCAYSGSDGQGNEQIYFGSDDGYIYQAEKGRSWDGNAIDAVCRPAFNFLNSPEDRKRFKKVLLEVDTPRKSSLQILPELDYSGPDAPTGNVTHTTLSTIALGGGGYYNSAQFNEVFWSTAAVWLAEIYISGVGRNISVVVFSNSDNEEPHTINSMLIHWSPRARRR